MYKRKIPVNKNCELNLIREVLYGKWKIHLIYYISSGVKRPGELAKTIEEADLRVINMQLHQLEKHGVIKKKVYVQLPPKVEYRLTKLGESLVPIVILMGKWGIENRSQLQKTILENGRLTYKSLANKIEE